MSDKSEQFLKRLLEFFPTAREEYYTSIEKYGEVLETVIIEDIFMPRIVRLIKENENMFLLKRIFDLFESVSCCEDRHLKNVFSITVLEILGNDKEILCLAQKYMGVETMKLQLEADRVLGRI